MVSKELGNASFNAIMSLDLGCNARGSHLRWLCLGGGAEVMYKDGLNGMCEQLLRGGFVL